MKVAIATNKQTNKQTNNDISGLNLLHQLNAQY